MQDYHVYGMGNALVDIEFDVNDQFFTENEIEKGFMTLVDEQRQNHLMNSLGGSARSKACGGSAANTLIALAQLGGRAYYSCKVANDEFGDFYAHDLTQNGVSNPLNDGRSQGVTGKCMVMISPDAQRTMNTFLGTTETFSTEQLRLEELKKSQYLYVEGYLVTSPTAREAVAEALKTARANGVKTALTSSDPSMAKYFGDGLKEMIGEEGVDLLFCNTEEAQILSGYQDEMQALLGLRKYAKQIAMTRSEKGALLFDGERVIEVATQQVKPIDTNGAGDLFAGAFLYALTQGHDFQTAGQLACACSSQLVTQFGPRLTKDQALMIKDKILNQD